MMALRPLPDLLPPETQFSEQPPRRAGAVSLSLLCAVLWPVSLGVPILITVMTHSPALPDVVSTLEAFFLFVAPPVGIVSGLIGLYRSFKTPTLRASRFGAIVGLVFGCLWLVATRLLA